MRRISLAAVTTIAGLVLLFSYRTSTAGPAGPTAGAAPPGIVVPAPGTATPGAGSSAPGTPTQGATNTQDLTVNGTEEFNGFGPVQVQVKIFSGRIVDVTALELPGDRHSDRINSFAVPELRQEVIDAQSAQVDTVSGATATTEAYARSLQAALDMAHFKGR